MKARPATSDKGQTDRQAFRHTTDAALTIVQRLPAEEAQAVEVEEGEAEQQVLVKEEQDHAGDTGVGPATVHQQEGLQVAELGDAEVTAHHSLHAFLTTDAHSCTA